MDTIKRRLVVLGAGESGTGAAILAKDKGFDVFLSDSGTISPKYRAVLEAEGIAFEEGTHSLDRILSAHEIVKSPGNPKRIAGVLNTPGAKPSGAKPIPSCTRGTYSDIWVKPQADASRGTCS